MRFARKIPPFLSSAIYETTPLQWHAIDSVENQPLSLTILFGPWIRSIRWHNSPINLVIIQPKNPSRFQLKEQITLKESYKNRSFSRVPELPEIRRQMCKALWILQIVSWRNSQEEQEEFLILQLGKQRPKPSWMLVCHQWHHFQWHQKTGHWKQ